ncbi:AAA family ATPase [Actinosynnema sp. CA-248983]
MSNEAHKDPLVEAVERRGVEVGSAVAAQRIEQTCRAFVEKLTPELTAHCQKFFRQIDDDSWKALFVGLAADEQRGLLKLLRLPGESWRRSTPQQQAHFVVKLRSGLGTWKDPAVRVAHDLTKPVRTALVEAARLGAPWQRNDVMTAAVRATAVALCPKPSSLFLPVVLAWMREHDTSAFDLLMPHEDSRTALQGFWAEMTAEQPGDVKADQGEPARTPAQLAEAAHQAVAQAVVTCRDILAGLERGLVPDESALAELTGVRQTVLRASVILAERLSEPVEPTLNAIDAAVKQIARSSDDAIMIRRLVRAEVPSGAAEALNIVIDLANGVLDRWPPMTERDIADVDMLTALVHLAIDASADEVDDAEVEARYERLRETAPKDIVPLLTAAVRGRINVPVTLEEAATPVDDTTTKPPVDTSSSTRSSTADVPIAARTAVEPGPVAIPEAERPQDEAMAPGAPGSPSAGKMSPPAAVPAPAGVGSAPAAVVRSTPLMEATPPADHMPDEVTAKVVAWLDHGQFALVHHVLRPYEPALAEAAGLAALATAVTGPGCEHEPELETFVRAVNPQLLVDGDAARLLTTGVVVMAAVTTGSPALGRLLVELSDHMDKDASTLAGGVGEAVRRGVLAGRGATALIKAGPDDGDVSEAAAGPRARLDIHPKLALPRASAVLARLRGATMPESGAPKTLGDALHVAAADQRAHVQEVKALLGKLSKTSSLERLIDDDDEAHRPPAGKMITGQVRQSMLSTLRDDISAVDEWVRTCERHSRSTAVDYDDMQLDALRRTLLEGGKAVLDLFAAREHDSERLVAAAARAACASLARLIDLIEGRGTETKENAPASSVLALPMVAFRGTAWKADTGLVAPSSDTRRDRTTELLEVPDTGLDLEAVALEKAAAADFDTAHFLVSNLPEPRRTEVEARLADLRADHITRLREDLGGLRRQLVRAGISGADDETAGAGVSVALDAVTESQLIGLVDQALATLNNPQCGLTAVLATRASVEKRIDDLRRADARRLSDRLNGLAGRCAEEDVVRVRDHIERGQLDLAEDDLEHLAANDQLFQRAGDDDLDAFYPAGVSALVGGIDSRLLTALRDGTPHRALPAVPLPEPFRTEAWTGLKGWFTLRTAFSSGWTPDLAFDNLLPALRLVGLEVRRNNVDFLNGKRPFTVWARGRRFLDVEASSVTGKALVPAFGSSARGRYRLLIVWNEPTVEQLDEWREADDSALPLIICYLGTLSTESRLRLAALWWDPFRRATIVLDDALLTWVATRRGNYDMFMRLALPFTATQPFMSEKDPDVPTEMFYGREQEKRQLLQPGRAPSIVYGGRGMGKSALMRKIESNADNTDFVVVWFEVDRVPGIDEDPNLLWGDLAQRLRDKGVGRSTGGENRDSGNSVTRTVQRWLQEKSSRRLLLLLDEAEGFVDGDAPKFAHVRRLLDLATSTESRCQVVFAGLHSVQHYSVGNSPLSPTGHLQIGPLGSQPAHDLVARPLSALGYRLDDDDVQRILLHCSYQPYLIQLVAAKLLSRQFTARGAARTNLVSPPWQITSSEVAEVLSDHGTRRDLRAALGLTLDLDKRTRVITNVLALHAYENSQGARMPEADLYAKCRKAWPRGFEETEFDAFRQLLDELAGLGILAESADDRDGRAIRNETLLRALGSMDEMTQGLSRVSRSALPVRQAREYYRPVRKDDVARSPLVNAQLAQLFSKGNSARVVVGSDATGIDQVMATLEEVKPRSVDLHVVDMKTLGDFKAKLETGATDTRRSLVVGDLRGNTNIDACQRAFDYALGDQAGVGIPHDRAASRTAALIAGAPNVKWLLRLAASPDSETHVMPLQRYNRYTLPLRWRGDAVLERLADEDFEERALKFTGGWPMLVEQLVADILSNRKSMPDNNTSALDRLRDMQSQPEWCEAFLRQTGADFAGWPEARPLIAVLVEYDGPCSPKDLSELVDLAPSAIEVFSKLARWLGLVSATNQGELTLAPLIAECLRVVGAVE